VTPGLACPVVTAGPTDLDALSQVIADAFHDLAPSRWLINDPDARRAIFPAYFRIYAEHALAAGVIHTTPDRAAAALWLPAGPGAPGEPPDYGARLAAVTAPWTSRFVTFDAALEARHPAGFTHHHLALLAVRPDRQGQGTGTALLRAYHEILDRDNMPAYLEASGPRTRRIYLHHGYTDQGPLIQLPDGPAMYPMVRCVNNRPEPGVPGPKGSRRGQVSP